MDTPIALGISLCSLAQYLAHWVKVFLMPTRKYLHIVIVYILYTRQISGYCTQLTPR